MLHPLKERELHAAGERTNPPAPVSRLGQRVLTASLLLVPLMFTTGCTREGKFQAISMWNESRLKPMEGSPLPGEASVARPPAPGSIARGELRKDDPVLTGRQGGKLVTASPVPVNAQTLARGQERYLVHCSPCHGQIGNAQGMIVKRGFPPPPDYALVRLKKAPLGHFYDVMTNGYGVMFSYAHAVPVPDRWAIANYLRVLQARRPDVTEDQGEALRIRARMRGIQDPNRPMRTPDPLAPEGHGAAPEAGHGTPAAPAEHGVAPAGEPGSAPEAGHGTPAPAPTAPAGH